VKEALSDTPAVLIVGPPAGWKDYTSKKDDGRRAHLPYTRQSVYS